MPNNSWFWNGYGICLARNKLIVLVEAQSTWSPNIIARMFLYLAKTYQEYIYSDDILKARLYSKTKISLPVPELYVIYTGNQEEKSDIISLKKEFLDELDDIIDLKAKVIFADENRKDIIGQYIAFCVILKQQIKVHKGNIAVAIKETIKICIAEGNLRDYLEKNQKEVEEYMFALLSQEEAYNAMLLNSKLDDLKAWMRSMKKFLPSFEAMYEEISSIENYSDISKETIEKIYDEV